ncbi:MAG: DUF2807 domain-containing protein [Candidatus Promineifilaceae bacterium]|nr:DUF2807 domain-containing protein [Candidatus Promineifilaceae bacterium]
MERNNWQRERRPVGDFQRLVLRHLGRLTLAPGPTAELMVAASAELFPKIQTEVRGDTLYLEIGRSWLERVLARQTVDLRGAVHYQITVPRLHELAVVGRGQVDGRLPPADAFTLRSSGSATIALTDVNVDALTVELNGQADVALDGQVDEQALDIRGTGVVTTASLTSRIARVNVSGQAEVNLWVTEALQATITGMGRVRYRGQPTVQQNISGMGDVQAMGE